MHRCLTIVEVQRSVFREVHDNATLARLARTCHAFHGAALDSLWASLNSFTYIIRCLPRDLWKTEALSGKLTFQRPMSLKDWNIFFKYSSRIRVLNQRQHLGGSLNLDDDVVYALSNSPFHGPLAPYLKVLFWDKIDKKYAPLLRLLLTPSLVSFTLFYYPQRGPEVSVLTCIGALCPSLENLHLFPCSANGDFLDPSGQKILSEALLNLHSLKSLTCHPLDEAAIIHLSRLPHLTELSFSLSANFQVEKVVSFMNSPAFTSIESFTVHANALSTLTSLLKPMCLTPHTVSFVVATTPTSDALHLFSIALVNACGSTNLSDISLITSNERKLGETYQQITLSAFQPLLALSSVNRFVFDAPCDIALDDNAITTLAKHWPVLTLLSVNPTYGWGITSCITHRGLIALLSHCPSLFEFALSIDFSEIDVPPDAIPVLRIGDGVSNDECTVANFVTSAITHPVAIAAFLSDVCLNLQKVKSAWCSMGTLEMNVDMEEMEAYQDKWGEVVDLLRAFSAVRRQDMNWAAKKAGEGSGTSA